MLISSILNCQTAYFDYGNDLPYIMFLPTYAATAFYHGKIRTRKTLETFLKDVEKFAEGDYTLALAKGDSLPQKDRTRIATELARFTGLSEDFILRSNLRIEIFRFTKELLRDTRRTVGRLDSRFLGIDRDSAGENFEFDPSMTAITGPYTATLNDYPKVWPWSYAQNENNYVNVAETLRSAMSANPYLKVHVANGFFDLATPYFATRYTFNHLGLDASLQNNISMSYYPAGHMMYIHIPSLVALKASLVEFIQSALPAD
jgi:carboxypeptidase C (cathepsin A)